MIKKIIILITFLCNVLFITYLFAEEKILGSYLARLIPILFALVALVYQNSKKHVYLMMIIRNSSGGPEYGNKLNSYDRQKD